MLVFIVNNAGAVIAAPKHRMSPFLETVINYSFIVNQKESVGTGDDTYINFCDIVEAAGQFFFNQPIQQFAG